MTAITTTNLRINSAEQLLESVSEPASTMLYVCYGKNTPWPNDLSPNTASDTIADKNEVWRDVIAGKKITGNDITLAIKRVNWTANTVYTQYDDTANNLYDANTQFYVLTSDYNVYKCLYNNNSSNSTSMPTYTSFNTTSTESDGYIWKYMYTLNTKERQRFLSDAWMPVKSLSLDDGSAQWGIQSAAVDGAIDVILVSNAGSGYTNSSNVSISITGDGTGANATAYVNTTSNTVANIVVTSKGTGYTFANVVISGGAGSGANARAIISPYGGHGSNPVYELGGSNILIDVLVKGTEDGILVANNDYRQVSIIKDPTAYGTSNVFSNSVFTQSLTLALAGSGPEYTTDEYVYQGATLASSTFSGRVLLWDSANSIMKLTEYTGTPTTTTLNGQTSGAYRYITSTTNPNLKNRSGQVLYIDNITPVTRAIDQTENFKIVIKY
jgi:hypothetical protein